MWKPPLDATYAFSSLYLGMHSSKTTAFKKRERFTSIVEKLFTRPCYICFFINTAALSVVNTLCISLFLFARQCSADASGACLQSNRPSPLFLCFLSVVSDRRRGWAMSATSSCTGGSVLVLVSHGACESCHFPSKITESLVSQHKGRHDTSLTTSISICKYRWVWKKEHNRFQISNMDVLKRLCPSKTVKLEKRRLKNPSVFIFSVSCALFCIVMAIFSQCSPPSVGMWYLSKAEWKRGGGRKWCSLIPESLTSNHANLVHFEANPAPTICRVKTTIYYACIAPSLW